ncbi:recQ-mediated genome instability protein 2-like isoform X2 [Oratosquilla oratoria]|uniref:recQ-mediated genome instability protein 2-like isoform X2 n=1 Tax=Oratosquilla oratoria TaxID=337810 RepID=UPI003F75B74F
MDMVNHRTVQIASSSGPQYVEGNTKFTAHLVWLQGEVFDIAVDRDSLVLSEDGHKFTISKCQSIPGGNAWLARGQYVMVIGEVGQASGSKVVKAMKMADLTNNPIHSQSWPYEVQELKNIIVESQSDK